MINTIDYTSSLKLDGVSGQPGYQIGIAQTSICQLHDNYSVVVFNDSTNHNLYLDLLSYSNTTHTFTTISRTLIKSGTNPQGNPLVLIHPTVKKIDSNNIAITAVDWTERYGVYLLTVNIDTNNNITIINDNLIIVSSYPDKPDMYYYKTPIIGFDVIDNSTVSILFGEHYGSIYMNYIYDINGTQLASFAVQSSVGYYPKVASLGGGYYLLTYTNWTTGTNSYVMSFHFNSSNNTITQYNTATITHSIDNIDLIAIDSTHALLCYSSDSVGSYARVVSIDTSHNITLNTEYLYVSDFTYQNSLINIDGVNFGIAYGIIGQTNIGYLSIVSVSGNTVSKVINSSYGTVPYSGTMELSSFGMINIEPSYIALVKTGNQNNGSAYYGWVSTIHLYDSTRSPAVNSVNIYTASSFKSATAYIYTNGSWHRTNKVYVFTGGNWSSAINSTDTTAPSVPTGLVASNILDTSFDLSWSASTDNVGVLGYNIYKDGAFVATTGNLSYSFTGLTASTKYYISVSAYDAAGNESAQSVPLQVTTAASSASSPSA